MAKPLLKKIKPLAFLLLILISTTMTLSFLPQVRAETKVISLTPSSGYVETTVQLVANISTVNGTYVVQFNGENVTSGIATENDVNASFIVPHAPEGAHNVTIIDTATGENDTTTFTVLTFYSFEPIVPESPTQLQENASVTISINMTGGQSNYTYPNVTVQTPSGSPTYEALKNITTTVIGDFFDNLTYPSDDFSSGANTNFTGEYKVLFNETVVNQFFIGLTNSSKYHRGDIVNIKAVDYYSPNENATLTIKFGDTLIDSINWTAIGGIINYDNWTVPSHATVGSYTLSITPVPNSKQKANDTQIFEIPGFKTEIFTRNLANKTVPNIFVKAYDNSTKTYYNTTSDADGLAVSMLELGDYGCEAFFEDVRVGEINFTITKEEVNFTSGEWLHKVNFTCQLTTMNINVIDEQNISIPQVSIDLSYNYTTNLAEKENKTGTDFGETNITGTLQLPSLLPNITYTINASRYGEVFNQDNNTLYNLPAIAYAGVTIICPVRTLQVNVMDAHNQSIEDIAVKAQELMGGLSYSENTDINGTAVLNCTFGKYVVKVYASEILLNETTIDLFQNQNMSIICKLYGLNVSIKVVDYFGQPIPNANVTLQREGLASSLHRTTQPDGVATFSSITGGNLQIAVYLSDQPHSCVAEWLFVDSSKVIEIKLEKYVVLAGFLVETSNLTTAMIIAATVLLVLLIEVNRRKRLKPQKSSS